MPTISQKIMNDYKSIPTSAEVYAAIKAAHPNLKVFGSYSNPEGDPHGNSDKCSMFTSFSFDDCDFPIIEVKTTWDKDHEKPYNRLNEKHFYWICVGEK